MIGDSRPYRRFQFSLVSVVSDYELYGLRISVFEKRAAAAHSAVPKARRGFPLCREHRLGTQRSFVSSVMEVLDTVGTESVNHFVNGGNRESRVSPRVKRKKDRRHDKSVIVHPGTDCEYGFLIYTWKKHTEFEPSRHGVEVREFYVVKVDGKEMFTYAEGAVGKKFTDTMFPYVCGEIISSQMLAFAGQLKNVYTLVQRTPEQIATVNLTKHGENSAANEEDVHGKVGFSDESPMHVRQRYEMNTNITLNELPLVVDRRSKVLVFRMQGQFLYIQLMPTLHSDYKLVPGSLLFDEKSKYARAVVGNMFSHNDYVVNCAPNEFCVIHTHKNAHGSARLRIVCFDRRGRTNHGKADFGIYQPGTGTSVLSSIVNKGIEAIVGGNAGGTTKSAASDSYVVTNSNMSDVSPENELLYEGVVNDKLQITDTYSFDKKNMPPKSIVTVLIDDRGVIVNYQSDNASDFRNVYRDPNISYSIMLRPFYNAKASAVAINTAARDSKTKKSAKRSKSLERLI